MAEPGGPPRERSAPDAETPPHEGAPPHGEAPPRQGVRPQPGNANPPRAAYLGPEGTFSEEALLESAAPDAVEPVAVATIRDAVVAVQEGAVELALVPIENSVEGPVTVTLDTLTGEAQDVRIAGEAVLAVRHCLIAGAPVPLERITTVISHPHVPGQCSAFLHQRLPQAQIGAASSTAEAVRTVGERRDETLAAIGTRLAAQLYGCTVLQEGIEDRDDNETRFVWLARAGSSAPPLRPTAQSPARQPPSGPPSPPAPPLRPPGEEGNRGGDGEGAQGGAMVGGRAYKTSLVFWGAGADRAGWLVLCLNEFARREINLTKIESRPRRERLGHYMFFVDLQGPVEDERVRDALAGLRSLCEQVRVLGSYPSA